MNLIILKLSILISALIIQSCEQNVSMKAWVNQGYYFSHRCEVSIEIISNYFQTSYQLFHVLTKQNAYFFNTVEYDNAFYIKGTNSMEAIMTSSQTYCKFPMTTTYYCPFISITGYDPYGIKYFEAVNSTHRKLTIRLARPICPSEGNNMSFRIQMPIPTDYTKFYMYVPTITQNFIITVDKLSFVFDQQVMVDTSNLAYKQVKSFSYLQQNNLLIGCKLDYSIRLTFENLTYYDSWDEIDIYISNISLLSLSSQCQSNMTKSYSCSKTSYGYQLINLNQTNMNKSYEIFEQQYYLNDPVVFSVTFGLQFVSAGNVNIQIVCKANSNSIQQSWLNMTHNSSQIYGRKIISLNGFIQEDFLKLNTSNRYDPLKCVTPIIINTTPTANTTTNTNTTNTTNTSNTTNKSNSTNSTNSTNTTNTTNTQTNNTSSNSTTNNGTNDRGFTYDITTGFQVNQLIFLAILIVISSITLFFTQSLPLYLKLVYLISIIILSAVKVLFLVFSIDQDWLLSTQTALSDSLISSISSSSYSLELFILKYTFILQFVLNFFYFFNYLILLICSKQIGERIKKYYGTKYLNKAFGDQQDGKKIKINKCNFSSVLFTCITFLTFLFSFKVYGILIFKLQLNLESFDSDFKKYRFKNSVLYKLHIGHLTIDLLLEFNVSIWMFLLIKSCQNQTFTIYLYALLGFYCIHTYLLARALKVFYLMARKTNEIKRNQQQKLKTASVVEDNLQTCKELQKCQQVQQSKQEQNKQNQNNTNKQSWFIPFSERNPKHHSIKQLPANSVLMKQSKNKSINKSINKSLNKSKIKK